MRGRRGVEAREEPGHAVQVARLLHERRRHLQPPPLLGKEKRHQAKDKQQKGKENRKEAATRALRPSSLFLLLFLLSFSFFSLDHIFFCL